jgi:hypothetical protein
MKKLIALTLIATILFSFPVQASTETIEVGCGITSVEDRTTVPSPTVSENNPVAPIPKYTETEIKIMYAGISYIYGHYVQGYRYESAEEILADFDIEQSDKNIRFLKLYINGLGYECN